MITSTVKLWSPIVEENLLRFIKTILLDLSRLTHSHSSDSTSNAWFEKNQTFAWMFPGIFRRTNSRKPLPAVTTLWWRLIDPSPQALEAILALVCMPFDTHCFSVDPLAPQIHWDWYTRGFRFLSGLCQRTYFQKNFTSIADNRCVAKSSPCSVESWRPR